MKIYQALFFLFCHMVGIGYGQPSFLLPAHCGPNKKGFVTKSLTGVGSLVPTWIWDLNVQRRQQLSLSKQLSFLGGLDYCIKKEFGCSEKLFFFFTLFPIPFEPHCSHGTKSHYEHTFHGTLSQDGFLP